ncbi:MAG: hypothetical protein JWQ09_4391 [Segetibacter sp.]|nr:hypothetical protein [Segetibacter sp.]
MDQALESLFNILARPNGQPGGRRTLVQMCLLLLFYKPSLTTQHTLLLKIFSPASTVIVGCVIEQ